MGDYSSDNIPGQIQAAQNFIDSCRYKVEPPTLDTLNAGHELSKSEEIVLKAALDALTTYFTGENSFMDGYHPGPLTIINNGSDEDDPDALVPQNQPVP